jgi:hypothetical protein
MRGGIFNSRNLYHRLFFSHDIFNKDQIDTGILYRQLNTNFRIQKINQDKNDGQTSCICYGHNGHTILRAK